MAFRYKCTCETYGLRYARPDPERRADMSASQSVLQAHRYHRVIESLSKSKFAVPLSTRNPKSLVKLEAYAGAPLRKFMMPEKSAPACPCALNNA
ncbi:hypothetical protein C9427_16855 [Mesorhizobium helmanticense]|uniref:Uncharacterized protein n=1 Tax=Mesorhizobium helmanticense TaxID=1776423 RepID=A0A2T4IU97_9HYPH|nr:hypothetical protein C9427_16855 [Mesorhizobium helmanticense]